MVDELADEALPADADAVDEVDEAEIAGGDLASFYRAEFPRAARLALLLTGDRGVAEELTMEAFVRVAGRWRRVVTMDNPGAYLRRIVVNLASSRWRRAQLERRALSHAHAAVEHMRWDIEAAQLTNDVLGAVQQLPARQRACVVLRYFEDLPEAGIAAALGCSVGTVKSQLHRARAKLAELLHTPEEGGEDNDG